jgi:hypothetical protein
MRLLWQVHWAGRSLYYQESEAVPQLDWEALAEPSQSLPALGAHRRITLVEMEVLFLFRVGLVEHQLVLQD